jgi:hypothetical protein
MAESFSVTVKRATFDDLDLVAPLFDAYRQFYRKPADLVVAKTFLAERFKNNESIILLATGSDDAVVGFVQMFRSFSSGAAARILILNDLFVVPSVCRSQRPSARGSGVFTARSSGRRQAGRRGPAHFGDRGHQRQCEGFVRGPRLDAADRLLCLQFVFELSCGAKTEGNVDRTKLTATILATELVHYVPNRRDRTRTYGISTSKSFRSERVIFRRRALSNSGRAPIAPRLSVHEI